MSLVSIGKRWVVWSRWSLHCRYSLLVRVPRKSCCRKGTARCRSKLCRIV